MYILEFILEVQTCRLHAGSTAGWQRLTSRTTGHRLVAPAASRLDMHASSHYTWHGRKYVRARRRRRELLQERSSVPAPQGDDHPLSWRVGGLAPQLPLLLLSLSAWQPLCHPSSSFQAARHSLQPDNFVVEMFGLH